MMQCSYRRTQHISFILSIPAEISRFRQNQHRARLHSSRFQLRKTDKCNQKLAIHTLYCAPERLMGIANQAILGQNSLKLPTDHTKPTNRFESKVQSQIRRGLFLACLLFAICQDCEAYFLDDLRQVSDCPGGSMVEHQTSNLRVGGSSPPSDVFLSKLQYPYYIQECLSMHSFLLSQAINFILIFEQMQKSQYQKQLQLHSQQQQEIRLQVEAQSSLISDLRPISLMLDQFVNNEGFYIKVQHLHQNYSNYRKTRRDGSCFYRALALSVFERVYLKKDKGLKERLLVTLKAAKEYLIKAGFQGMVFEDMLQLLLEKLDDPSITKSEQLIDMFCDPSISNYIVLMMRFLTSGQLKNNAVLYQTFIEEGIPMEFFCQTEVEQIDKEADQIQIMALLNYLGVGIKIIYLDGNVKSKEAYTVVLPENTKPEDIVGTLLYRPGHYDILYA